MHPVSRAPWAIVCALAMVFGALSSASAAGQLACGADRPVQAGGTDITVAGYSVPSFGFWNDDALPDLIVGEGGNGYTPKLRVYLNSGTPAAPVFGSYSYAKSNGADLTVEFTGCLGMFPRLVQWASSTRKDLLVGQADGRVKLFTNIGTDAAPAFDGGTFLQAGPAGQKAVLDVGDRATCSLTDFNRDGIQDLLVGAYDGKVRVYLNLGSDATPDFNTPLLLASQGSTLLASSGRSSPVLSDLDGDGIRDLLTGDTNGQLFFYRNTGTDTAPAFAAAATVTSDGVAIDLAGSARSRPSICDWDGDGGLDLLVGAGDGKVHRYAVTPEPATLCLAGAALLLFARRR